MSGLTSPSTTNLLSSGGNDTIAPDVDDGDLEAGRGAAAGKKQSSISSGNQLAPSSNGTQGGNGAQGQMNVAQREQSIWEQSACVHALTAALEAVRKTKLMLTLTVHFCRHPVALFFLLFFRSLAIVVYLLCGFFSSSCKSRRP